MQVQMKPVLKGKIVADDTFSGVFSLQLTLCTLTDFPIHIATISMGEPLSTYGVFLSLMVV